MNSGQMKDQVAIRGEFKLKSFNAQGELIDEYFDPNLIVDAARVNMARVISGVENGVNSSAINRFALGTRGHVGTNVLVAQKVGESDPSKPVGNRTFNAARTSMFSEAIGGINYHIAFDPTGGLDVTAAGEGTRRNGTTDQGVIETGNVVRRHTQDRTVTYTVTIPVDNATSGDPLNAAVAYTEAALYAGDALFAMKTFPARVKDNTVRYVIEWTIIF